MGRFSRSLGRFAVLLAILNVVDISKQLSKVEIVFPDAIAMKLLHSVLDSAKLLLVIWLS
jgi:hypothetical protein